MEMADLYHLHWTVLAKLYGSGRGRGWRRPRWGIVGGGIPVRRIGGKGDGGKGLIEISHGPEATSYEPRARPERVSLPLSLSLC